MPEARIEGNSDYELESQLRQIWKSFLNLSLREKYALVFKERRLCNRLIFHRCCKTKDIAAALEVSREEFIEIYRRQSLGEEEIARLLERKLRQAVSSSNVTKARQRARAKLRQALETGSFDGKTFDERKT